MVVEESHTHYVVSLYHLGCPQSELITGECFAISPKNSRPVRSAAIINTKLNVCLQQGMVKLRTYNQEQEHPTRKSFCHGGIFLLV